MAIANRTKNELYFASAGAKEGHPIEIEDIDVIDSSR